MSHNGLTVSSAGDVTVVAFEEPTVLDAAGTEAVREELLRLADVPDAPKIVVDFSGVKFLASRMLGVLAELTRQVQARGGRVVICGLPGELYKVFKITQLDRLLTFADDPSRAVAACRAP